MESIFEKEKDHEHPVFNEAWQKFIDENNYYVKRDQLASSEYFLGGWQAALKYAELKHSKKD